MVEQVEGSDIQAPDTQTKPLKNTAVVVLSIVVGIETLALIVALVGTAYLWGELRASQQFQEQFEMYGDPTMGMPAPEDDEMFMAADTLSMDVSYLIIEGDTEAYMDLYDPDDTHVDLEKVEADFLETAAKAAEQEGQVDFMSDMMPITYEDSATGETIVKITLSGLDYRTGMPAAGRLTVYGVYEDGEIATLTGREDRDLEVHSTYW